MKKFKELLEEGEDRTKYSAHLRMRQELESLRFQKEEAIKKVTEEWNKKIEEVKKKFRNTNGDAATRLGNTLQKAYDATYNKK